MQGRSLPQPDRTWALARAGAVLVRLGRAEAGRKLIDEAAADAARLGTAGIEGYARGVAARALAPFDLERALALVEPFRDADDKDRYTGFVAVAIAATDPDRAVALADAMHGRSTMPDMVRTEIACRIGAEHPDRAVRIIEGMKSFAADKMQAEAFAWLAVAVAPRDRARAVALIDRALALPVDRPREVPELDQFRRRDGGGRPHRRRARHAGYPDMDSVIMRVMATRTSPGGRDSSTPPWRSNRPRWPRSRWRWSTPAPPACCSSRSRPAAASTPPSSPRSPATTGSAPGAWWTSRRPGPSSTPSSPRSRRPGAPAWPTARSSG